jgi:ATP-binding cassette subfamily B protein
VKQGTAVEYNPSNWDLTKRLLGYIRPFWKVFVFMIATALGRESLYSLVAPLLVMLIVDYILVPVSPDKTNWFLDLLKSWTGIKDPVGLLAVLSALIVVLAISRGVFFVIHRTLRAMLSQNILRVMRREFYRSLMGKSLAYLNQVRTGQIISRVTSDMGAIDLFYSETVREAFRMTMQLVLAIYVLLQFDVWLTIVCCLPLPFIFVTTRMYSGRVRPYMTQSKAQLDRLNSVLVEGITGQKLIKSFGQEKNFEERFDQENRTYVKRALRATRVQALYRPSTSAVTAVGMALIITYGGLRVIGGEITIGQMILFVTYFNQLVGPVRMYSRLIDYYQDGITSARRVFEVVDVRKDIPEASNPIELPRLKGAVEFDNVSFSYEGSKETLSNVSLKISPGEKVALMGFVGSGKTTLAELVPRFYDVSSGRVLVDGYDVRDASLKSLRSQIGIVLQDTFIFSTTIGENIAFGKPQASEDEIVRAAQAAQIHDYIISLPKGYDTVVGERGLTLSGGQRQRISIARTLLTEPTILILDDSTSNVDAETEILIRKAVESLLEGRTALIITQRASTCEAADRVVVMDEGRIVAVGKHSQLLESSDKYRMLIESQTLVLEQEVKA